MYLIVSYKIARIQYSSFFDRTRDMKWSNVIGQEEVKTRLRELVRDGHIPHAIMLSGETGYGTLALAMAFASTLLCRFSATKKKASAYRNTYKNSV